MKPFFLALAVLLALAPVAHAQQLPRVPHLTLDAAKRIGAAAETEARRNNWNVAIAVVDAAGGLIYFQRLDDTQPASLDIAIRKARTSAGFKRPTRVFEEGVLGGRTVLLGIEGILPIEGGLPVIVDGHVIGAIGVSGVTPQQDGVIAQAGIAALSPR
jgi:glc operon protein GlcG